MVYTINEVVVSRKMYVAARKSCIQKAVRVEEGKITSTTYAYNQSFNKDTFTTRCLLPGGMWFELEKIQLK